VEWKVLLRIREKDGVIREAGKKTDNDGDELLAGRMILLKSAIVPLIMQSGKSGKRERQRLLY
jgi:hypothetical protein